MIELQSRYQGALLGLATGDALGTTLEFKRPGTFAPITDMVGGGPFGLKAGQWTDDTSMALCLAESLISVRGFDLVDQLQRYVRWYREGYFSSTGRCFDIGGTTRQALHHFIQTGDPYSPIITPQQAGNGSIMRLAPVPMAFGKNRVQAIAMSAESSKSTHGAPTTIDACRYLGDLIWGALNGIPKEQLLAADYCQTPLETPEIAEIAQGSFMERQPPQIQGSGYVVKSLEAALWAFHHSTDFRDGCLLAVNLGDDADTTGAIYGQLAGAYYGAESIPTEWKAKLTMRELMEKFANQLLELAS